MQQARIRIENMIEKRNHMSPDRLAEINDFIDFIQLKDQDYTPNAETIEAMTQADRDRKDLKSFSSVDEMFKDLGMND